MFCETIEANSTERKKLKCDRLQPCAQCVKSGRGEQCVYDERAGSLGRAAKSPRIEEHLHPHDSMSVNAPIVAGGLPSIISEVNTLPTQAALDLQGRVQRLERLLNENSYRYVATSSGGNGLVPESLAPIPSLGPRKQYHGLKNTRSLIALVCPIFLFRPYMNVSISVSTGKSAKPFNMSLYPIVFICLLHYHKLISTLVSRHCPICQQSCA
jgi:hypothetical protein